MDPSRFPRPESVSEPAASPATVPVTAPVKVAVAGVGDLNPVSRKLMAPMLVGNAIFAVIVLGFLGWAVWQWGWGWLVPFVIAAVYVVWKFFLIPFQVRNLGWLETDDELVLSRGKMWHTLTVVPYGRIQFVDVTSGPIHRQLGLKNLTIHTASSTSNSKLPGLPAAEADALRARLAVKARERMSGL